MALLVIRGCGHLRKASPGKRRSQKRKREAGSGEKERKKEEKRDCSLLFAPGSRLKTETPLNRAGYRL
jgi:hypothetical protein